MESPTRILVLTRRKYKVHADIRQTLCLIRRSVAVLDTGAEPNLICKDEIPSEMPA